MTANDHISQSVSAASCENKEPLTVLRPDRGNVPQQDHAHHEHEHRTDECEKSCLSCPNLQAEDLMDLTLREVFGI